VAEAGQTQAAPNFRLLRHEILLCLLGLYTSVALVIRAGIFNATTIQAIGFSCVYFGLAIASAAKQQPGWQKARLFSGFVFVLWYFTSVASFVPAIGLAAQDAGLLGIDRQWLGETPSVAMQSVISVSMTEMMSAFYLSYLVYLLWAVVYSGFQPIGFTRRFADWILSVYAMGLAVYLLIPAIGPGQAFPELFTSPLEGPLVSELNRWVVGHGSGVYDVFPSLHVMITGALLIFDFHHYRPRFRIMLLPSVGMVVAAVYLRYHYAIDLLAGCLLLTVAWILFNDRRPDDVAAGE
jgi:hypothetical protein